MIVSSDVTQSGMTAGNVQVHFIKYVVYIRLQIQRFDLGNGEDDMFSRENKMWAEIVDEDEGNKEVGNCWSTKTPVVLY